MPKTQEKGRRIQGAGAEAVEAAQAEQAGLNFQWHFGRITRMGVHDIPDGRSVTIVWEEGGVSSQQGGMTGDQWEILKLAFTTSGRIAILSDMPGDSWMYDFRFLEAVR